VARLLYQFKGPGGYSVSWGASARGTFSGYDNFFRERFRAEQIRSITASRELPGRTHYDPPTADVPVGRDSGSVSGGVAQVIAAARAGLPEVVLGRKPDFVNEGQPAVIYQRPPIILPGQVDPGREEHEEGEVSHTWTHLVGQVLGVTAQQQGLGFVGGQGSAGGGVPAAIPAAAAVPAVVGYAGSCPPRKTRTLTIDCETGLEVKKKRTRQGKMLTNQNMAILFQIATLPNSANVRTALARAIK